MTIPLQPGLHYHIFNRGNNRENLFYEERNYKYFLNLYTHYIYPFTNTYAFCLMPNHFHLLVQFKTEEEYTTEASQISAKPNFTLSRQFSNLFNAYTKSINKAYGRTGSLFAEHFNRLPVTSDSYFLNLVFYIHYNPQKKGFIGDFRTWRWSSYHALKSNKTTHLVRDEVLGWFGDVNRFEAFHKGLVDEKNIAHLIESDLTVF